MNKLNNNKGTTLVEMLCAVIILLLVSSGLAAGVSLANKYYIKTVRYSEAAELSSTISNLLTNELKYTNRVCLNDDGTVSTIYSTTYGLEDEFPSIVIVDDDGNVLTNEYGQVAFKSSTKLNRMLSVANYNNDLGAKLSITYNKDGNYFTVVLDVGTNDLGTLVTNNFDVRCLNIKKGETTCTD